VADYGYGQAATDPQATETAYSKEPKLKPGEKSAIRERLRCSQKYYEKHFEKDARTCRRLYKGFHWSRQPKTEMERRHWVVVNYLLHAIETIVSSIAFSYAEPLLKPQTPEAETNEDRSTRALKWGYRISNAHRETKRALKDAWVYGFGAVMVHWLYEMPDTPPVEGRPGAGDTVMEAVENGEPLPPPVEPVEPLKDQPLVKRLDPRQIRIPTDADWVVEELPWIGFVEVRPLDEVKADPRFRKGVTRRLKGSAKSLKGYLSEDYRDKEEDDLPPDVKRVCLHHYFEKRRRLWVVFADDEEEPVMVKPWYWEYEDYPIECIFTCGLEDEFYRTPMLLQWEHEQRVINLTRSMQLTHIGRFVTKYVTRSDAFGPEAEAALQSGEDGAIVKVNAGQTTEGALSLVPTPGLNVEVYNGAQTALQDLQTTSTLSAYESGNAPTKRMTNTETEAVQGAGAARRKASVRDYEEFCARVAERIFDLEQQFATRTRELPIYDPADPTVIAGWEPWDRERIQGDYDFDVHVGSTEIKNTQGRVEAIGFLLQALQPYAAAINVQELIKQLLRAMPEVRDVNAIVTAPQPMAAPGPAGMPPQPGMAPEAGGIEGGAGPPGQIPAALLAQLQG